MERKVTQFKWSSQSFTQKSLDLAVLIAALVASVWISHLAASTPTESSEWLHLVEILQTTTSVDLLLMTVLLVGWNLCLSSLALYGSRRLARWRDDLVDVMWAVGLCTFALAALAQVFEWKGISRWLLLSFWLLASTWLFASRLLKRFVLREVRLRGRNLHHVIIVGAGPRGQHLADILNHHPELGFSLLGFVDDMKAPGVIGPLEEIARILASNVVDEMMIALPVKKFYPQINQITRIAEEQGIIVRFCSELFDLRRARTRAEQLDDVPVFTLYTAPLSTGGGTCMRMRDAAGWAACAAL